MDFKSMTLSEYTLRLASKDAVPGGGTACALAGAMAACLSQMVCNLTLGKKRYAQVEADIAGIEKEMQQHMEVFLNLSDRDAIVFEPLAKAYRLPEETDEQKEKKAEVMEGLLEEAALVPLKIMEEAVSLLDALEFLRDKGSVLAVSDVGVGAELTRTAIKGAMMNVKINTKSMRDRVKAGEIDTRAFRFLKEGIAGADEIFNKVLETLS